MMNEITREQFKAELRNAKVAIEASDRETAWIALQRAHILGQADPVTHAIAHWEMLKLAWRQRDVKEIAGQLMPTVLAVPFTLLFGRRRSLRDGRVNISDAERRSIPEDIQQILNQ